MMLRLISAVLFTCFFFSPIGAQGFPWPEGARASVVLTYDDGIDSHLDHAYPDLEEFQLKGTFYVTGSSESLRNRMDEWRLLVRAGHEIGNHTLFHPCLSVTETEKRDWVQPEWDLKNYTLPRIRDEIRVANTLLTAVDGLTDRTLAYTCVDMTAGGVSYVESLGAEILFARAGGEKIVTNMAHVDLLRVPSWSVTDMTGPQIISLVKEAVSQGGLLVLMFHGVGGDYLAVTREAHREVLAYLHEHRDEIWNDTFLNVMSLVKSVRSGKN